MSSLPYAAPAPNSHAPGRSRGFSLTNLNITRKLALGFAAVTLVSVVVAFLVMRAVDTMETAGRDYEIANRLLTNIGKAEAANIDRMNLARHYLLSLREDIQKRYFALTKDFDKAIDAAKKDAAGDQLLQDSIENIRTMARQWTSEFGDPGVSYAAKPDTYSRGRELITSSAGSEKAAMARSAISEVQTKIASWLDDVTAKKNDAASIVKNVQLGGAIGIVAILVLIGWWLSHQIARPVSRMTGAMRALASGDHTVAIPAVGRRDEVGQMAAAVATFKEAAIAKLRLEAEAEASRAAAEAERAASAAAKAEEDRQDQVAIAALGEGLDKLAQGDLLHRIDAPFPDKLAKLRADFNDAVEKLQQTLASISTSVRAIHAGTGEISSAADD
ncbi:HAMP domain-containing protein, partial [Mesorhizobium sp. KR1-2]|uniref:HAMP domain-containing protein n=1 Tax=Mesorhizobium sp. KR1-2 TaxID=3156609 RepID=UPI0032B5A581